MFKKKCLFGYVMHFYLFFLFLVFVLLLLIKDDDTNAVVYVFLLQFLVKLCLVCGIVNFLIFLSIFSRNYE
jgi:hypothetical protein